MTIVIVLFWIAVIGIGFMVAVRANTMKLNNRRRPDGSYADYDFPGIFNGGNPVEILEPDLKGPGPHQQGEMSDRDLYGRPLPPEVAEKRSNAATSKKQTVFVLQHTTGETDQPKLLGVYGSSDRAKAAMGRFRQMEEFAQYPGCFHLVEQELDKDVWGSGLPQK